MQHEPFEIVVPTSAGRDLDNVGKTKDAHIRIETYKEVGTNLYVDVFDSMIEDPHDAHTVSEVFPWANRGAEEATRFLQKHGFRAVVMLK